MIIFLNNSIQKKVTEKMKKIEESISPKSSPTAMLRLRKDMEELSSHSFSEKGTIVKILKPHGEKDQTTFICTITPVEGPFAHGTFVFMIQVPHTYPFSPPSVKCLNRVFHPNFDFRTGSVFLPILADNWRPVLTMNNVILAVQRLFLETPDRKNDRRGTILNKDAHQLIQENSEEWLRLVRATMNGGHFFGEHWASTLRNGPDGTGTHIKPVRKRNYSTIDRPQKRRCFRDNISLSDLRFLSLNDEAKSADSSVTPVLSEENHTRKRSLDLSGDRRFALKRRKRPSSVLGDDPYKLLLPDPDIFFNGDEERKNTKLSQSMMMVEDL